MQVAYVRAVATLCFGLTLASCGGGSGGGIVVPPGVPLAIIEFDEPIGSAAISPSVGIGYGYETAPFVATSVFAGARFTPADAGATRVATSASDPAFDFVVGRLTDGVDDLGWTVVRDELSNSVLSRSNMETVWLAGGISGQLIPDLVGHTVTSILLEIDQVDIASPGSDPNADGIWTDYRIRGRFILRGQ